MNWIDFKRQNMTTKVDPRAVSVNIENTGYTIYLYQLVIWTLNYPLI